MNKQRLHQLFWKYVDEQLTAAEELEFLALMAQPEAREEADRLRSELWETRYQQASFPADDHSQRRIDAVMKKLQPKKVVRLRYWMAAACMLLLAGTAWWLTSTGKRDHVTYVFAAGAGERKTITMPDQSVVHLNAGSRITYDEAYNEDGRELTLEGEAFFEVTEDPQKPFKVLHGGLTTEVLGTSFNIYAYNAAADMKVTVATGRVRVSGPANATLAAGQSLTYVKSSATANVTTPSHVEQSYSWKDGVLAFDSERLGDIAHTLERWYNVTVHLEGEGAANCRFTGAFERLPLEKVLSLLSKNGNFSYRITGRDVYITGIPCP